jgi:hypothetical protein
MGQVWVQFSDSTTDAALVDPGYVVHVEDEGAVSVSHGSYIWRRRSEVTKLTASGRLNISKVGVQMQRAPESGAVGDVQWRPSTLGAESSARGLLEWTTGRLNQLNQLCMTVYMWIQKLLGDKNISFAILLRIFDLCWHTTKCRQKCVCVHKSFCWHH